MISENRETQGIPTPGGKSPAVAIPLILRVAALLIIWAAFGAICRHCYQTDGCPPDVKRREAMSAGLAAPLFLAMHTGVFIWGYLITFAGIAVGLLRARRPVRLTGYLFALIALCSFGTWNMICYYAHYNW